jgi:hypothetical protein
MSVAPGLSKILTQSRCCWFHLYRIDVSPDYETGGERYTLLGTVAQSE